MKNFISWFVRLVFGIALILPATMASTWATGPSGTYDDIRTLLRKIQSDYPKNAKLITIGLSNSGLPIEGLEIGSGATPTMVVATHHGNEYGSTEVALAFAKDLAARPVAGQTTYVIPVLNIRGYNANSRYEFNSSTTVDPNRDYPGPCTSSPSFALQSTAALAKFVDQRQIVASATLHTFYPAVVYPWGFSTLDRATKDQSLFEMLVNAATTVSNYAVGNSAELIYPADGTFEDYAYLKHGIWSLLFEIGDTHQPDNSEVTEMIRTNVPGLRNFFEHAPTARASDHAFTGKCDSRLRVLDRHDE